MQIVRELAGYSLGRSDLLRRAMSKKKVDVMQKEREIFLHGDGKAISGAVKNGVPENVANQIFDEMIDFAKYAFNKSHAAAYAVVAYQTAYLKTHYRVEFMAALMTSVMENATKITGYMETCRKMDMDVLPPDINEGHAYFDVSGNNIIYGLAAIRNVGKNVVERIVEEREKNGPFTSLTNFYNRMDSKDTNKKSIESLILAGAFDKLGGRRSQYMAVYKQIADGINMHRKNNITGQIDLFTLENEEEGFEDKDHLPDIPEFEEKDLLNYEKDVLGIYLSGHPLDRVRNALDRFVSIKSDALEYKEDEENDIKDGMKVIVGGILAAKKLIFTKSNKKMAFLTLEDTRGTMEVVIFPNLYEQFAHYDEESVFVIKGHISIKEESSVSILADQLTTLEELVNPGSGQAHILLKLQENQRTKEVMNNLLRIFAEYRGNDKVIVENVEDGIKKAFPNKYNIQICDEIVYKLTNLLGETCVTVNK